MAHLENQPKYPVNNEEEVTIWELVTVLVKEWKTVLIIILGVVLIGTAYAFSTQNSINYIFNQKIIYDDYDYYPLDFVSTYELYLGKYLNDKLDNPPKISMECSESSEDEYYLKITYSKVSLDEANEITQDIIDRHNTIMYDELDRLINLKEEEVSLSYDEYKDKQNEYSDFLYSEDGYYNTENDLSRYQNYVNSYKKQLESREKMLLKVQNGFPLLLEDIYLNDGMPIEYYQRDEIIENHYSAESLQKEVEFLEGELAKSQQTYNELTAAFEEMVTSEVTLKTDRDIAIDTWKSRKTELEKLEYDFTLISEYYIDDFLLAEESGSSFGLYITISFMMGILLSVMFICLKISYLDYNSKSKDVELSNKGE